MHMQYMCISSCLRPSPPPCLGKITSATKAQDHSTTSKQILIPFRKTHRNDIGKYKNIKKCESADT